MLNNSQKAHLALFIAALIYGINYTFAKDVMPDYVEPFGFIVLRALGALIGFWGVSFFLPKEKIKKGDWGRLILCGLFGVACNQLLFFKGLNITTPINASIIMTSNPILVLIAASIIIKERITPSKIIGILLGMAGAITLLSFGAQVKFGQSTALGDLYVLINAASYGVYIVLAKPLMAKYSPVTVVKWVFTFGFCFVLPVGYHEASQINWVEMPLEIFAEIAFVVVCTTFFAYLLNIYGLKSLSPAVVSSYIYLQPILAAIVALSLGKDTLNMIQIGATVLIFAGVYLVSKSPANT